MKFGTLSSQNSMNVFHFLFVGKSVQICILSDIENIEIIGVLIFVDLMI